MSFNYKCNYWKAPRAQTLKYIQHHYLYYKILPVCHRPIRKHRYTCFCMGRTFLVRLFSDFSRNILMRLHEHNNNKISMICEQNVLYAYKDSYQKNILFFMKQGYNTHTSRKVNEVHRTVLLLLFCYQGNSCFRGQPNVFFLSWTTEILLPQSILAFLFMCCRYCVYIQ